jgi:hypothetical protein
MIRLLCIVLLIGFAVRPGQNLAAYTGSRLSIEQGTVVDAGTAVRQTSAEASSTVNSVSKASSQSGTTADIQINKAIAAMAHRIGTVLADYSTNQKWATCPNWGTQNITLVLYPVTYTIATNCTIPSNVTLQVSDGSCLAPAVTRRMDSCHAKVLFREYDGIYCPRLTRGFVMARRLAFLRKQ